MNKRDAMFDKLLTLFSPQQEVNIQTLDLQTATAALFVHLTAIDGVVKPEEQDILHKILSNRFGLDKHQVKSLIETAQKVDAEAVDFYKFTSLIKSMPEQERIKIIEEMWQIVYADNEKNELEDSMVWRVSELLGISSRDRMLARKRVLEAE